MFKKITLSLLFSMYIVDEWMFDRALYHTTTKILWFAKDGIEKGVNAGAGGAINWYAELMDHAPITGISIFIIVCFMVSALVLVIAKLGDTKEISAVNKEKIEANKLEEKEDGKG